MVAEGYGVLFPWAKGTGRQSWIARSLRQGRAFCQEQTVGAPQAPSATDSACKSNGGARSRAIPYLFRHEAPSYPPAA